MSDPREALVALILERFRAAETYMDLPRQAGLLADAIQSAGWTPPSARCCDPATIETRIDGDWLVDVHQHHTCGTDPDGHYGAHEPGCGRVPVVNLRELPGWTPPGEHVKPSEGDQWWESLVEAPCDQGHRVFIDDGDGGVYACPACALLPTVKPSLEQVVDALAAQRPGSAEWTSSRIMQTAHAVLALLHGRTETEVRAEAWDEVADYLDRTNAPSLAEAARRDNPYRIAVRPSGQEGL